MLSLLGAPSAHSSEGLSQDRPRVHRRHRGPDGQGPISEYPDRDPVSEVPAPQLVTLQDPVFAEMLRYLFPGLLLILVRVLKLDLNVNRNKVERSATDCYEQI